MKTSGQGSTAKMKETMGNHSGGFGVLDPIE
jgi:hypothetical protein